MNVIYFVFLAIVAGFAVTLQGQFMALMDKGLGTKESVLITYGGGGIAAALLFLLLPGNNLKSWSSVPWYAFSAGIFGLIIIGTIGYVLPRIGVAKGFTLIVAAQFLLAALIDHYGWLGAALRPLDPGRMAGLGIMMVGVWLVVR